MTIPGFQNTLPGLHVTNYQETLHQTALRRQINAELVEIGELLSLYPSRDEITIEIMNWHEGFKKALRKQMDVQFVLDHYIALLKDILRDPISQLPLDEESYLGSDGIVYGQSSLHLYLASVSEEVRARSLLNPLHYTPHHVARHLVCWLQRRLGQSQAPKPSEDLRQERLKRIRERSLQLKQKQRRDVEEYEQRIRAVAALAVHEAFQPIHQSVQKSAQDHLAKIEELRQKDQERMQGLQLKLCQRDSNLKQNTFQAQLDALQEAIENTLEAQIRELEEGIICLKKENALVGNQITTASQECKQVQVEIHETQKALKKRKKNWLKQVVLPTLAAVGASAFTTWAMQSMISSIGGGFNVTLEPSNSGARLVAEFII